MSDDPRDPGWGSAFSQVARRLIPVLRTSGDPLTILRTLYLSFWVALVLILWILSFLEADGDSLSPGAGFAIVTGLAAVNTSIVAIVRTRPLTGFTPDELAGAYRSSMFIRLAIAESIAMVGLVLFFVTGSLAVYGLAALLTIPGFLLAAPTSGDIAMHQRLLDERGENVDLFGTLIGQPRPGW